MSSKGTTTPLPRTGIPPSISISALGAVNESPKPYSQLGSQNIVRYLDQATSGSQVEYLAFIQEANAKANWESRDRLHIVMTLYMLIINEDDSNLGFTIPCARRCVAFVGRELRGELRTT